MAWSEVAGSYDLTFGHSAPVPQADHLRRDLLGDVTDVVNAGKGDVNMSHTKSFSMNAGKPNERRNILNDIE